MKKNMVTIFQLGLIIILLFSCQEDELKTINSLDRLNWSERNYLLLNQLITENGIGGKDYDDQPYVVMDWDQTCAHFDTEEATLRFQVFNLRFKMTNDQFREILKDTINGVTQLPQSFQNINLADVNEDLINDYDYLYDHFSGLNGNVSLDQIKLTSQYRDFIVKILFLYNGYCSTEEIGDEYGYLWVLYLFYGFSPDEVKALAKEAIEYELGNCLSFQTLVSPDTPTTKAGVVQVTFKTGLRVFAEMQNLISTFIEHGISVFIVSASYKPVIETFSGTGSFGYNLPAGNVIGMELNTDSKGKILPEYKTGWVKTYRQGKVDAINKVIKTERGKKTDPLFVAGDSDGDYEMLTQFPGMKLALIWNRVKGGDIGTLCKQAVEELDSATPKYLLQGRNENTGMVIASSKSILLGESEPQLLDE